MAWSLDADVTGVRALWLAWFRLLRDVEPNILHWNLMEQFWVSARYGSGLVDDPFEHMLGDVQGPLSTAQALLALRFLPLEGEVGVRIREQVSGLSLSHEVNGQRFSTRFLPAEMLL